jgi:hypothetical protein
MGTFQNNPSIGWLHPKSTHAHPLAWANKKLTRKPITLSIQPTFDLKICTLKCLQDNCCHTTMFLFSRPCMAHIRSSANILATHHSLMSTKKKKLLHFTNTKQALIVLDIFLLHKKIENYLGKKKSVFLV